MNIQNTEIQNIAEITEIQNHRTPIVCGGIKQNSSNKNQFDSYLKS